MKRNWELIRKILVAIENLETIQQAVADTDIAGYAPEVVSYHMMLLYEAKLIKASCHSPSGGVVTCNASQLTWAGHEFSDKIRSQGMWNKTLVFLRDKGIDLSFDTIKAAAAQVASNIISS